MSKKLSILHLAAVSLLLIGIAIAAASTAGALISDKARTGLWSGSSTQSTQLIEDGSTALNHYLALHGGRVLAVALCIVAVSLTLLWLELRGVIRRQPHLVLSRGAMGMVSIRLDQVGLIAQREAEHVSGVREVATATHSRKTGIDVRQIIAVEPDVAFAQLAERVQQRVKQSLEFHLGFPVARVEVLLQQASLRRTVV